MKLSVVIAAFDERENIEILTRRLDRVLRALSDTRYEILFVVEGSDGTKEIVERLAEELGNVRMLYGEKPSGLGNAFRRGFAGVSPDADFVVTMDADLNHSPEEIPRLLEEICRSELDVLVGSRFLERSQNEGIPIWKWFLSIVMNRLIAGLFDVDTRDKTSGFRIYRMEALQELTAYRNNDFAFLPEILIRARDANLRVGESPIHFKFRTRGQSKMSLVQTSRSYLILLRSRFDSWSVGALVLLALGVSARVLYSFPVHKYVPDADSLLSAIGAFDILGREPRVFFFSGRIGALESYVHAAAYLVLGVSRTAISLAPLLSGMLALLAFFFLVRELFGREPAFFALLIFALPSPAYMAWTYMPNGHPETLLFCVTTLYLAARLARTGIRPATMFLLGLMAGLGVWNSLQTLGCTVPAIVWLLARRKHDVSGRPQLLLILFAGLALGASPWILYEVRYLYPSLHENVATRPGPGMKEMLPNARYLVARNIPELAVGMNPFWGPNALNPLQRRLRPAATVAFGVASLGLVAFPWLLRRETTDRQKRFPASSFVLVWLVVLFVAIIYTGSENGKARGESSVRYILPLFLVFASAMGILLHVAWRRWRVVAAALALAPVLFSVSGYYLPWTRERHYLRDLMHSDQEVVTFLEGKRIRWICGNYWVVYPFVFESQKHVLGIPFIPQYDYYAFARMLPKQPVPWALVARDSRWLESWVALTPFRGRIVAVGTEYFVFLPGPADQLARPPRETLELLQRTASWGY